MDIDCLRGGLDDIDYDKLASKPDIELNNINPFTDDDFLCDGCIEKRFRKEQE